MPESRVKGTGNMRTIAIEEDLFEQASEAARVSGDELERFVAEAIHDRILRVKRERFLELSAAIGEKRQAMGISEEEILEDFDQWRKSQRQT